jgi:hypothetical protein
LVISSNSSRTYPYVLRSSSQRSGHGVAVSGIVAEALFLFRFPFPSSFVPYPSLVPGSGHKHSSLAGRYLMGRPNQVITFSLSRQCLCLTSLQCSVYYVRHTHSYLFLYLYLMDQLAPLLYGVAADRLSHLLPLASWYSVEVWQLEPLLSIVIYALSCLYEHSSPSKQASSVDT